MASPRHLIPRSRTVQQVLEQAGVVFERRVCGRPTRTAAEAAAALGVAIEAIVKSLIFMADDVPVLLLVAGHHRADPGRLGALLGRSLRQARGEEVVRATGFAPGEVPPCGHPERLPTFCDRALLTPGRVWVASGAPAEMLGLRPEELVRVTNAQVVDLAAESTSSP
ncbi:MAG: aminoacyl-tRNA deacylase [Terriglobia bacterium]